MANITEQRRGWARQLTTIFVTWKLLLFILVFLCPRPGYDTSGLILLDRSIHRHENIQSAPWKERFLLNFVRWDAIYFVQSAARDKLYENEWAFSWAYAWPLRRLGQSLAGFEETQIWHYVAAGFVISNISHLLSVLVLYQLLTTTLGSQQRRIPLVAATLHILTPASLFMSAPYTESIFSLLNFAGMLQYARYKVATQGKKCSVKEDFDRLSSGLFFGLATLMRSNGLLSGLILLYDVLTYVPRIVSMRLTAHDIRRMLVTCVSGSLVAVGFVWPQIGAYKEFCTPRPDLEYPPWCSKSVPSVYSWVQSHYWNVGLFRYWTLSNLPLFFIAAPMLWLLLTSSATVLRSCVLPQFQRHLVSKTKATHIIEVTLASIHNIPELAVPQLVLAVAAITNFHVQIINRLASGYPTWYTLIAMWIVEELDGKKSRNRNEWIVRVMITYALTQGMLFGNFLPPA